MSELSVLPTFRRSEPIRLALIGMSGAGKSYWSSKLINQGFHSFCCDDLIEKKLEELLCLPNGKKLSMATWMGHPYEPQYIQAEQNYLEIEVEMMESICSFLREDGYQDKNVVVDTTGSLIYTGSTLIGCLREITTIVYLKAQLGSIKAMYETFLRDPKPVLWQGRFNKQPQESNQEALLRCYPELLKSRQREYERYADVAIDFETLHKRGFGVKGFLETIQKKV